MEIYPHRVHSLWGCLVILNLKLCEFNLNTFLQKFVYVPDVIWGKLTNSNRNYFRPNISTYVRVTACGANFLTLLGNHLPLPNLTQPIKIYFENTKKPATPLVRLASGASI